MTKTTGTRESDNIGPCACASFTNAVTGQTTNCTAETARTFAPGHDAKLKSLLMKAGIAGHKVSALGEGEFDALDIAARFGFAAKVAAGVARGIAKAQTAPRRVVVGAGTQIKCTAHNGAHTGKIMAVIADDHFGIRWDGQVTKIETPEQRKFMKALTTAHSLVGVSGSEITVA